VTRVGVLAALLFAVAGCGQKPAPSLPDTGSRQAAEEFFGSLITSQPARAYELLDPDSKRRVSADRFNALGQAYAKNLGFPAEKVHIQACEEQGDSATAHVVLTGSDGTHARRYSDGITLRRTAGRWGVILPANFGQKTH
jgi:hypothetical protein